MQLFLEPILANKTHIFQTYHLTAHLQHEGTIYPAARFDYLPKLDEYTHMIIQFTLYMRNRTWSVSAAGFRCVNNININNSHYEQSCLHNCYSCCLSLVVSYFHISLAKRTAHSSLFRHRARINLHE